MKLHKLLPLSAILLSFSSLACNPWTEGTNMTTGSVNSPVTVWAHWWCKPASGVGEYTGYYAWITPSRYADPQKILQFHILLDKKDWEGLKTMQPAEDDFTKNRSVKSPEAVAKQQAAKPSAYYPAVVAPNLASTSTPKTRPAYKVLPDGTRDTKEAARAVQGVGCNPNVRNLTGGYMAYAPDFSPNLVTLCKAVQ